MVSKVLGVCNKPAGPHAKHLDCDDWRPIYNSEHQHGTGSHTHPFTSFDHEHQEGDPPIVSSYGGGNWTPTIYDPPRRDLGDAAARKGLPICSGVLDYFPDALLEVARVSKVGNDQHNPGQPLHWAKEKSSDEADALLRHLVDRGTLDKDGLRHSAKVAWRALALLQREIEGERNVVT